MDQLSNHGNKQCNNDLNDDFFHCDFLYKDRADFFDTIYLCEEIHCGVGLNQRPPISISCVDAALVFASRASIRGRCGAAESEDN
jgi:hypothetical protein